MPPGRGIAPAIVVARVYPPVELGAIVGEGVVIVVSGVANVLPDHPPVSGVGVGIGAEAQEVLGSIA